jgi:plastocyanin
MRRLCYGLLLGAVAACGGGNSYGTNPPPPPPPGPPPPPAPGTVAVTISDNQYTPDTISIAVGTPVRWTNEGGSSHSVTADGGTFNSGTMSGPGNDGYGNPTAGATYTRTFSTQGTFAYHCSVHPTMHGAVIVTP